MFASPRVAVAISSVAILAASTLAASPPAQASPGNDLALGVNGGTVTATSTLSSSYPSSGANDGRRNGSTGYWNDGTQNIYPDTLTLSWNSPRTVNKVTLRLPVVPYLTQSQRTMGQLTLQYLSGSVWQIVATTNSQANPAMNWIAPTTYDGSDSRTFEFSPIATTSFRVVYQSGNSDGWSFLDEIEAYNTAQLNLVGYNDAINWLRAKALELETGSRRTATDGTTMYTPDGVGSYAAFWPRDFAYMVEGYPEGIPIADIRAGIQYLMRAQRADGAMPDHVAASGNVQYCPGNDSCATFGPEPTADNSQFMVKVIHDYWRLTGDLSLFVEHSTNLVRAMDFTRRNPGNSLVYITPARSGAPYGFTDTINKTGDQLFDSLLYYEAAGELSQMFSAAGDSAASDRWNAVAQAVRNSLASLMDPNTGMYFAASGANRQIDIWGSAYAVVLGIPTQQQQSVISGYLIQNYAGIIQYGQARHLPPGEFWQQTSTTVGTYQNGAYWGTPMGWIVYAIAKLDPSLARQTIIDMVDDYKANGVNEAINRPTGYVAVPKYVASATEPLQGVRLLNGSNLAGSGSGATVSASSAYGAEYPIGGATDGQRNTPTGYWNDGTKDSYPDSLTVSWPTARTVNKIVLRLPVVNYLSAAQRTLGQLTVQYFNGSSWVNVAPVNGIPNPISNWEAPVAYDGREIRTLRFNEITSTAVRVTYQAGNSDGWSFLEEIEVYRSLD